MGVSAISSGADWRRYPAICDAETGVTIILGWADVHGLIMFHRYISMHDRTCWGKWICSNLFHQARMPMARAAHTPVELNGRPLGFLCCEKP